MKSLMIYITALLTTASLFIPDIAFPCNQCHSKNPKMVKMHKELQGKNCFTCHSFKGKKPPEQLKKQMAEDALCTPCHLSAQKVP